MIYSLTNGAVSTMRFVVLSALLALFSQGLMAQSYTKGQHIEPAYEGWRPLPDGSFNFMFGYMNENWEEQPNVDIGENNSFAPGDPDRGQPTHFLPRRNRFTFEVNVPADWGDRELVWTLSVNGVERKAYATLKSDYLVDNMVIASETGSLGAGTSSPESRSNIAPIVTVRGDAIRTVRAGQAMKLDTLVEDDGLPTPTDVVAEAKRFAQFVGGPLAVAFVTPEAVSKRRLSSPPTRVTVNKVNGLFLSWNVYRGAGKVSFDPQLPKPWEDTRTSANSPWGALWVPPPVPADGMYEQTITFEDPGTYVLWGRADDGGLYHDGYVTVNVTE
jgi:hypothetical protein|tara:strand:- start:416 stop:1405 length:990 start_codon:yes stop_codon:yes gene_type:complete